MCGGYTRRRMDVLLSMERKYTRRRMDVLLSMERKYQFKLRSGLPSHYLGLMCTSNICIIFSCQTLQVEKFNQHLMLICVKKVWSCVQGLIICFRS